MLIQLTNPEIIAFVNEQIRMGNYLNAEAVIEDALTHAMESDHLTEDDISAIAEAQTQMDRGEYVDFDIFAAEMRKKYGTK